MGEPIWCDCGAVLVESISEEGVTPIGGEPIVFRRDTDFVVCSNCHKVYKAKILLAGGSLSDALLNDGGDDPLESLEKLVDEESNGN